MLCAFLLHKKKKFCAKMTFLVSVSATIRWIFLALSLAKVERNFFKSIVSAIYCSNDKVANPTQTGFDSNPNDVKMLLSLEISLNFLSHNCVVTQITSTVFK